MPGSPASCARRRSRSRRCRSPARAPTSTSATSRSPRASHRATADQIAAVRALLAKAPATEDDLELGLQEGRPPEKIFNNCSGKHAGMLALCRAHDWPTAGYRLPEHPVQQACAAAHAEAVEAGDDELPTATDGCGVVTFALPLERMAYAFARFEQLPQGETDRERDAQRIPTSSAARTASTTT